MTTCAWATRLGRPRTVATPAATRPAATSPLRGRRRYASACFRRRHDWASTRAPRSTAEVRPRPSAQVAANPGPAAGRRGPAAAWSSPMHADGEEFVTAAVRLGPGRADGDPARDRLLRAPAAPADALTAGSPRSTPLPPSPPLGLLDMGGSLRPHADLPRGPRGRQRAPLHRRGQRGLSDCHGRPYPLDRAPPPSAAPGAGQPSPREARGIRGAAGDASAACCPSCCATTCSTTSAATSAMTPRCCSCGSPTLTAERPRALAAPAPVVRY